MPRKVGCYRYLVGDGIQKNARQNDKNCCRNLLFWSLPPIAKPHDLNEIPRVFETANRLPFPLRQTLLFINKPEKNRCQ